MDSLCQISLRPRNLSLYELDTFNTPPQEQLYVTLKIGYVDAMPLFRSRYLALNLPLGHFNGDNARLSTRRTKLTVTPRFISSSGNMAFVKLRRTQFLACPTTRTVFSALSYLHFVSILTAFLRDLQHKKQTQYSMLQIKTILKNTFRLSASYFHFSQPSEEVTKHKHVTTSPRQKTRN